MIDMKTANDLRDLMDGKSYDDLRQMYEIMLQTLKNQRNFENKTAAIALSVGEKVEWIGKRGKGTGTITKINRTKAVVKDSNGFTMWTIPMSMLKVIE